jgi:hypothetical protein
MHVCQKFFDCPATTVQAEPRERSATVRRYGWQDACRVRRRCPVDHVFDVRRKEAVDDRSIFAHYSIEVSRYDFGVRLLLRAHHFPT